MKYQELMKEVEGVGKLKLSEQENFYRDKVWLTAKYNGQQQLEPRLLKLKLALQKQQLILSP